jgi:hypothetical protein
MLGILLEHTNTALLAGKDTVWIYVLQGAVWYEYPQLN